MQTIINQLNEVFAPMDAEVLESSKEWARSRVAALATFKASEEYQALRRNVWALYPKLHTIAGGKTWYALFNQNTAAAIDEFMTKNCAAVVAKRNAMIAKKLTAAEVTDVTETKFTHTRDGFDGIFRVTTNKGDKRVEVRTIRAGGYNIQCLHLRVLVSVK